MSIGQHELKKGSFVTVSYSKDDSETESDEDERISVDNADNKSTGITHKSKSLKVYVPR